MYLSPAFSLILFFRTVKSNETKSKKTFDRERVMHQVKYLGLLENIKVRRAGFAFRQEFHTFNERYKYLGKGTLSWKGDDASRCKAILKEVSEALGLTKDQAQIGRSKLFLKQPQTLFQLEKLRSKKFGVFAKVKASVYTLASLVFGLISLIIQVIQRAYRSWSERKALINTRLAVAKSFLGKKQRRAQSIFRPFTGQCDTLPFNFSSM
jgi:myosin-1